MKTFSILIAICLSGCAAYWQPVPGWEWNGQLQVEVVDYEIYATPGDWGAHAERNKDGSCTVTILRSALIEREKILAHEKMHCAGFDHPDYKIPSRIGETRGLM